MWAKTNRFVNLIAATADDARDIMVEGESGILAICPKYERPFYRVSKSRLEWPNGSKSLIFTADEPERLRGKQHEKLWCLCAGTMVSTPSGKVPIQNLQIGDEVITRSGSRKIIAAASHMAIVGRVLFSNGSELIGTADHPVLSFCGWTRLDKLFIGQNVQTVTSEHILACPEKTENEKMFFSIDGYGNRLMALFRNTIAFTTKTGIPKITNWRISYALLVGNIKHYMLQPESAEANQAKHSKSIAVYVIRRWIEKTIGRIKNALNAIVKLQRVSVKQSEPATIAEKNSFQDSATFAVSVASTWERVGKAEVFNITVEEDHEYFANGILTHNCDELAAWRYLEEAWDQAMMGLRLGKNPQAVVTTTPRPLKVVKELIANPANVITRGTTYNNRSNLSNKFFEKIISKYEGTRLGRQELNAEILDDNPRALWQRAIFDKHRVNECPELMRIVVGLDPNVKNRDRVELAKSSDVLDEAGIVVAGIAFVDGKNHYFVMGDYSLDEGPNVWGNAAVKAYRDFSADRIIGEVNNGGDMVEATIRAVDQNVSYKSVTATRGKAIRAEPIAALYEQGRVHHVGSFPQLEDECCEFDPITTTKSPNRMDALVWALTELSGDESTGFLDFMHQQSKGAETDRPNYSAPTVVQGFPG